LNHNMTYNMVILACVRISVKKEAQYQASSMCIVQAAGRPFDKVRSYFYSSGGNARPYNLEGYP
jgi:hypothetical protein